MIVADPALEGHELVAVATWPDRAVDGIPFVGAEPVCSCGEVLRACGGRDVEHAEAVARGWHEVHRRVIVGRTPLRILRESAFLPGTIVPTPGRVTRW